MEKEFIKLLEDHGIDTTCFMGSGYHIEDVVVGSEFYLSYAYIGRRAKQEMPDTLKHVINGWEHNYPERKLTDRYKLLSKYRYVPNKIFGGRRREEYVTIKNLRTGEVSKMTDEQIDSFFYCLFDNTYKL